MRILVAYVQEWVELTALQRRLWLRRFTATGNLPIASERQFSIVPTWERVGNADS